MMMKKMKNFHDEYDACKSGLDKFVIEFLGFVPEFLKKDNTNGRVQRSRNSFGETRVSVGRNGRQANQY